MRAAYYKAASELAIPTGTRVLFLAYLAQEINMPSKLKYSGGTASTSQTSFGVR